MPNATSERALYIGIYLPGEATATTAAIMKMSRAGNAETGSLAYGLGYLQNPAALPLHPEHLALRKQVFDLPTRLLRDGGAMPLVIKDALPDAWGRLVIAHELGGRLPSDDELLLLTNDDRVGALVFSETVEPPAPPPPPRYRLQDLAEAVKRLQYDLDIPHPLRRLLHRGGSLGGARPKASLEHEGALWLAKFPALGDPVDVQLLEAATFTLARQCGIRVPQHLILPIGQGEHALLSRRFDRIEPVSSPQRLHVLSASALLGIDYQSSAGSYVELAQLLRRLSIAPAEDLQELYRRMVFNILVDNSDDHLKNHAVFHLGRGQIRLTPAYDIVPQLTHLGYQMLSIDGENHESNLERAIHAAPHFGLASEAGRRLVEEMTEIVYGRWRPNLQAGGLPPGLQKRMESCFQRQAAIVGAPARYRG